MIDCAPPRSETAPLRQALPALACDAHCHIFGPADVFPYVEGRPYTPPDAPFEKLRALHEKLGIARGVIVQPGCHGTDMRPVLDALEKGRGRYRAVALLAPDISDEALADYDARGVRGVRFNFMAHLGGAGFDQVERIARRIGPLGWHICLHTEGPLLASLLPRLEALGVPFVIDHMGRVAAAGGLRDESFQALLGLQGNANAWVKISGPDRISSSGKRPFADARPFVQALVDTMPEQLLWGTDWPHPNVRGEMPDDGELVNFFTELCPDPAVQETILVTNPQALYRFDEP